MTRRMSLLVRAWPWVLALMVLAPVFRPGFVLAYDMVFVPDLAFRADFLGTGRALPRAVPSDAVVAVADELVPGMWLQKLVLLSALVLAGAGAQRLVPRGGAVAALAATSAYVWNPYVFERLALGHWPVLLAHAALPWVVVAARRFRSGGGLAPVTLWVALAAIGASGGVMAGVVALAFGVSRSLRRNVALLAAAVAVNAPWLLAGLAHAGDAVTDPEGVAAFAARGEGPLPVWLTVLGLGGAWNAEVVPASRQGMLGPVALAVVAGVAVLGLRRLARWWPRRDLAGLAACALVGLLVALAGALAPDAVAWAVAHVPGAGLLRDGPRFLGLFAVALAAAFAAGAAVVAGLTRDRVASGALAAGVVLAPLALLPDLAWGGAGRLEPVRYPQEYAAAREVVASRTEAGRDGSVLVLPFTAYRAPDWNGGRRVLDPLGRYLPVDYLASDDLYVSGRRVAGEDPRAAKVAAVLEAGDPDRIAEVLSASGVRWVVLDREAAAALGDPAGAVPPVPGEVVHRDGRIVLWELAPPAEQPHLSPPAHGLVTAGWVAGLGALAAAAVTAAARSVRRGGKRRPGTGGSATLCPGESEGVEHS